MKTSRCESEFTTINAENAFDVVISSRAHDNEI